MKRALLKVLIEDAEIVLLAAKMLLAFKVTHSLYTIAMHSATPNNCLRVQAMRSPNNVNKMFLRDK